MHYTSPHALQIKGLEHIIKFTPKLLREFMTEIDDNWTGPAHDIAVDVIKDVGYKDYAIFIVDDATGELVALCSYRDKDLFIDDPDYGILFKHLRLPANTVRTSGIYIDNIAGIGRGGASEILRSLIQISESEGKVLLLEAVKNNTNDSTGFYIKHGFINLSDSGFNQNSYFAYIPTKIRAK